jgi:hypothetical protein
MRQQSIWDIENRQPPRRISIGEAIALAGVFEISLEDLAKAPHESITDEITGVIAEVQPSLTRLLYSLRRYPDLNVGAWRGAFTYQPPLPLYFSDLLGQFKEIEEIVTPHLTPPEQGSDQ